MQWISIKKQRPEYEQIVLGWAGYIGVFRFLKFSHHGIESDLFQARLNDSDVTNGGQWNITHWMPLPPVPKE